MEQDFATVASTTLHGIDAKVVQVEVSIKNRGLAEWAIVGLPDAQIKESKQRVMSAIGNCGLEWPKSGFVINLSPAFERKVGTAFDLPIAVGIQCSLLKSQLLREQAARYAVVGELSLNGNIRRVRGVLSSAVAARDAGFERILVPEANAVEAAVVQGILVFPVSSLPQAIGFLCGTARIDPAVPDPNGWAEPDLRLGDFSEVKGQGHAKRSLEIAAAGDHNVLLIGPPGAGKTMLARRIPTILPPMVFEEALEVTKIHSVAGLLHADEGLMRSRPFRAPHHSITNAGLIGGGSVNPRPGEVSLAHNGVLFLDEMPELPRKNLELLRQPIEDGRVTITRVNGSYTYPCRFMFVGAMNPCPCGHYHDDHRPCVCTPVQIQRYRDKLSGPLLDRIDLHVDVPAVRFRELHTTTADASSTVAERVCAARALQGKRFSGLSLRANGRMGPKEVRAFCQVSTECKGILEKAFQKLGLSVRAYHRVLKVSRTIADLENEEHIAPPHIAEAIGFRTLDRSWWDTDIPGTP